MEVGIKGKEEVIVTKELTAKELGSGTLNMFGTPAMITLMEKTSWKSVQTYLEKGQVTVGILLEIKHISATPLGMKVFCESELIEVDGKRLTFLVRVFDEVGLIGEGRHERFIVSSEKFQKKTNDKLGNATR